MPLVPAPDVAAVDAEFGGEMLIKEYRITMPLSVEEYQVGQLFSVMEASMSETGGGEGVQVLRNEPFTNKFLLKGYPTEGQYTHKIYHIGSKIPGFIRMLVPNSAMDVHEEAWNAYPYCRTVITNPGYMKENFVIIIESIHLADRGETHNAHLLNAEKLKAREVIRIDIANDAVESKDYNAAIDPTKFKSSKTGRGPLGGSWAKTCDPYMTCYKLVKAQFKWFGLQGRIEGIIQRAEKRLFTNFHRQLFCWTDKWYGMTMEEIRAMEEKMRSELDNARKTGQVRGTRAIED